MIPAPLKRLFAGRHLALAGFVIILCIAACALFAPWVAPADPNEIDPLARLSPPGAAHPFGTDHFGRDTLSRVIHGSRMALLIGVGVVVLALAGGVLCGVVSAIFPRVGLVLMRGRGRAHGVSVAVAGAGPDRDPGPRGREFDRRHRCGVPDHHGAHRLRRIAAAELRVVGGGGPRHGRQHGAHRLPAPAAEPVVAPVRAGQLRVRVSRSCRRPRSISWGWAYRRRRRPGATCSPSRGSTSRAPRGCCCFPG